MSQKFNIPTVKRFFGNALIVAISLALFFGLGELLARAVFPEFVGQVLTNELTLGIRMHKGSIDELPMRFPTAQKNAALLNHKKAILIVGDSVSFGYGHAYEDIYWRKWERRLELEFADPPGIISLIALGNNFSDNYSIIESAFKSIQKKGTKIQAVVYQWNYNDLIPFSREDVQQWKHVQPSQNWLYKFVVPFRLKYLNRSTLQRVASFYVARLFRDNSSDCKHRGFSAGPYAYSFGNTGYEEQAERSWAAFERGFQKVRSKFSDIPFFILISPLEFQIDVNGIAHYRKKNFIIKCTSINPRERLAQLGKKLNIVVVDPTDYLRAAFEDRVAEGNPKPFYFLNDSNHPNERGSNYIAEFGYAKIVKRIVENNDSSSQ